MTTPAAPHPEHRPENHTRHPSPPRKRRAGLTVGIVLGGVTLALLIGVAGVAWFGGGGAAARFASDPRKPNGPDLYSDTPRCDAFSEEIAEEIEAEFGEPNQHGQAPENAEEASWCSWFNPPHTPVTLSVQVTRYGTDYGVTGEARAQALVSGGRDAEPSASVDGQWDFAVLDEDLCYLGARDSNLMLTVGMGSIAELNAPCNTERLLRYAKDWAERNFTK